MEGALAVIAFIAGVILVIVAAERFVEGLLGSTAVLGLSTFALGIIFGGFDPDNLGAGLGAAANGLPLVALGTVVGSGIFLMTAGLGITVLVTPLRVTIPTRYVYLTLLAPLPLLLLALDERLSRLDGLILLALFTPVMALVILDSRRTRTVYVDEEEFEDLEKETARRPRWFFPALMIGAFLAIAAGAELIGWGAETIVHDLDFSESLFGMLVVSAAVSFEEVARGVIPALRGHHEISIGNVLGTILFFVLFNAGILSLARPLEIERETLRFYFPYLMGALLLASFFLLRRRIGRPEGVVLLGAYVLYLALSVRLG